MPAKNSNADRDAPRNVVRRLLAGGEWVTAAEVADRIAGDVPAAVAEKTYARLARAGGRKADDPAERHRIGLERVAREALQHLVHRGEAEAGGEGSDRKFRLKGSAAVLFQRPKPKRIWVPLERLVFDPRLQMRDYPGGAVFGEESAALYAQAMEDGDQFPPLEAVEEDRGKRDPLYWVIAGFNRGEAYRRRRVASVEVITYPGTFADAEFWALSENSRHGRSRTPEDCRKAFDRLVSSPVMLDRVMSAAKDQGGVYRALAAACGLSAGAVGKYLEDLGVSVDRKTGRIVSRSRPAPAAKPKPAPAGPQASEGEDGPDEPPARACETPSAAPARSQPAAEVLATMEMEKARKAVVSLRNAITQLIAGPYRSHLIRLARGNGADIAGDAAASGAIGDPNSPLPLEQTWSWHPLSVIDMTLNDLIAATAQPAAAD